MMSTRSSNAVPAEAEPPVQKDTRRVASAKAKETVPSGINERQASAKPVLAKEAMLNDARVGPAAKKPRLDEVVDKTHEDCMG
jgi:hypothetical protein